MRHLQRIFAYSRKASGIVVKQISLAFVYMALNLVFRVCVWDYINLLCIVYY